MLVEMRVGAWSVALIAGAGVLIAANLVLGRLTGAPWLCAQASPCGVVHASRYAMFLGVPTAAWGTVLYLIVAWLALSGCSPRRWLAAFLLSVAGLATSAYLARVAWDVVQLACVYCFVSAGIAAALVVAVLATRPAVGMRGWLLRPYSLVVLGSLTALGTVAIVATVLGLTGSS